MKQLFFSLFKYLTIFFFGLYFLIWLSSPIAINYLASTQLKPYQLSINEQANIRYNPFISALTVRNLEIARDKEKVFAIDRLNIELNLIQLIFNKIDIKSFTINGLYTKLVFEDNKVLIAGIELPSTQEQQSPTANAEPTPDYQIILPQLNLTASELFIVHPSITQNIGIKELNVTELSANKQNQQAKVDLELAINQAQLITKAFLSRNDTTLTLDNELVLVNFSLATLKPWLPEQLTDISGLVNLSGQQSLSLTPEKTLLTLSNTQQSLSDIGLTTDKAQLNFAKQSLNSSKIQVELIPEQPASINGALATQIEKLSVNQLENPEKRMFALEHFDSGKINIHTGQQTTQLAFDRITLTDGLIAKNGSSELPAFTQFNQLVINQTALTATSITIDDVSLSGLVTDITLDQQKQVSNLLPITELTAQPKQADEQKPAAEQATTEDKTQTSFALAQFSLADSAQITFTDTSVEPAYRRTFTINELALGPINSSQPELVSQLTINGKSNKYAGFQFNGTALPFKATPEYNLTGTVNELNLPDVSTYIKDALKYEIKSGHLNLILKAKLRGEDISGKTNLVLQGIDLTAADDHEVDSISDQTAIPFAAAIGMLKDGDGNVELNIPLSGKTSEPSFGTSGFISLLVKQATMAAAKDYLITTFVPYAKVVSVALTASNHLLKVRFNDLAFKPKQLEFDVQQQSFLEQLSTLMKEKKDTKFTVCAVATPEDIELKAGTKISDQADIKQLHGMSQARLDNFKQLMVEQYQVASSRLLLCTPQIDTNAKAQPRLTFSSH